MKFPRLFSFLTTLPALWFLLALAPLAGAAVNAGSETNQVAAGSKTNSVTGTNSVAGTNAAPAELPIPLSEFDLTVKPTKDPFFPLSLRQAVPIVVLTNTPPAFSMSSFSLKGVDGPPGNRLALINNRTVAPGETAEVTTTQGSKIKIRCVEIKEKSVVIRAEGQPDSLEIFLRKAAQ